MARLSLWFGEPWSTFAALASDSSPRSPQSSLGSSGSIAFVDYALGLVGVTIVTRGLSTLPTEKLRTLALHGNCTLSFQAQMTLGRGRFSGRRKKQGLRTECLNQGCLRRRDGVRTIRTSSAEPSEVAVTVGGAVTTRN